MRWSAAHEERTTAAPEGLWELWADAARWPDWNADIAWARLDGPFAAGTTATVKFRRSTRMRFTITAAEPLRLFVDEAKMPGARMGHEHVIGSDGESTTVANRIYIEGPAARLYAALMGRRIRRGVKEFVRRERELAERARA